VPKKAQLGSEYLCFDEFPEYVQLAAKLRTDKLPGDLQDAEYLFVAGLQFREELLLQLKCDVLVGGQVRAFSLRNARNHEDAIQRLQRFVHSEVSFEETFHGRFAVLALNIHGLRHRSKPYRISPGC
jgi:hypothetical protein